ncbi:uncharacterized protein LOC119319286 [Triticum dicoccoides]|uniref:uncharacterized protein LOC119319286 n=1 Tax=Triticum dicoccoides TaxID=85692 RepID=UPI0018912590|nr:uncharacterized protein LOC119319286 [Triticum dicoccoides]
MSWTSGASSAPGFRRASGRRDMDSRSPVAYRESPMAYEPPKLCHCRQPRKAPRWISWSRQNPGRRYYACVDAMHGGCGYVEWHDDPLPKFFSDLIGDLRDEVWRLKGQRSVVQTEEECPNVLMPGHDVSRVMALELELKERNAELEAMNGKYRNVVMVFIVFVVGVVVGKMLVY